MTVDKWERVTPRKDVFIVGSCVTRDAFELAGHGYRIVDYVARSSFACSMLRKPFPVPMEALDTAGAVESNWQRRMVEIDLSRGLADRLDAIGAPGDTLLVVDFIDERFHLYRLNGALATGSVELQRTRIEDNFPGVTKIRSGTDEHFALWQEGFRRFVAHARSLGLEPIVNRVHWASRSVDETAFREPAEYIAAADAYLERLYSVTDALDVPSIDYGATAFVATSAHKWGLAPFHYTEEVYARFLDQLGRFAAMPRLVAPHERMAGA
jgi:hypothetical protein